MILYYTIHDTDRFRPENFPMVASEVTRLSEGIAHLPVQHKPEIILSYLKDHCIMNDWVSANPHLVAWVTSNHFNMAHTESLFESARKHNVFVHDFEAYMTDRITAADFFRMQPGVNDVTLL